MIVAVPITIFSNFRQQMLTVSGHNLPVHKIQENIYKSKRNYTQVLYNLMQHFGFLIVSLICCFYDYNFSMQYYLACKYTQNNYLYFFNIQKVSHIIPRAMKLFRVTDTASRNQSLLSIKYIRCRLQNLIYFHFNSLPNDKIAII